MHLPIVVFVGFFGGTFAILEQPNAMRLLLKSRRFLGFTHEALDGSGCEQATVGSRLLAVVRGIGVFVVNSFRYLRANRLLGITLRKEGQVIS